MDKPSQLELFIPDKTHPELLTTTSPLSRPEDSALSRKHVLSTVAHASSSWGSDVIDLNSENQRKRDGK